MSSKIPLFACFCLAVSGALFGQATGNKGGGVAAPIASPTLGRTPATTTTPTLGQPTTTAPDLQRPLYISGKVALNDGTPPPESVTLQMICSGSPRAVGYTDSKGRFSIDLSNRTSNGVFADATESGFGRSGIGSGQPGRSSGGLGGGSTSSLERAISGCDLQAALPGFRSDRVSLANRRSMDNPEVGTIILHRLANVEGLTISATTALAPKDARKAFEKGLAESKKEKWENAQRDFEKAVESYPRYATAWYELGVTQQRQNDVAGARKSYAQAMAADPKLVSPYNQLAYLAAKDQKWEEVVTTTDQVLRLNPVDFPAAWYYSALANYRLQKLDAAERSARKGLEADPTHSLPRIAEVLAAVLADKHDFTGAAQYLKLYLSIAPGAPDTEAVRKQVALLEKAQTAQAENKTPEK